MKKVILSRRWWKIGLAQSVLVLASLFTAWLLRFDFTLPHLALLLTAAPVLLAIRLLVMTVFDLHHDHWRHTGIPELEHLGRAVFVGSLVFFVFFRWICGLISFPLSVYVLESVLTLLFLSGPRIAVRMFIRARRLRSIRGERRPALIVGAGDAAALLLRELERSNYDAIGLLDDDRNKRGTKIHGVSVVGAIDELPRLAERLKIAEVLIAIPSASGSQLLRIADLCQKVGVPFRTLPGLAEIIDNKVSVSELRNVNVEDLLCREPIRLRHDDIHTRLQGQVVMVTGAAGSIGSELCRQIAHYHPRTLICVDQAETPLFDLQRVLSGAGIEVIYAVTDIRDTKRMRQLLLQHEVQIIFHAAAYKHVPMTEQNLYEVLTNNVFGLLHLIEAAEQCGCQDFLLISSDKAVNPSSFMGCTKRLGELILGSRKSMLMRCVAVRFGNVLGSQGSVIPLFQEQIRTRRSVTVTHPEMTRYFMTISESVSLVLQAFTLGTQGKILVLDMGEPVRIVDLARTLIRLSGIKEEDVSIAYSGMRPGEKLVEELFYASEAPLPTAVPKVLCAETRLPEWLDLQRQLKELEKISAAGIADLIRLKVKEIIPEYQWQSAEGSMSARIGLRPQAPPVPVIATQIAGAARTPAMLS